MKRRYVVLLDSSTEEQDDAFLSFIKENGLGWWHWLSNSWLITDRYDKFAASEIRDALNQTHPGVYKVVLELNDNGDTWAGFGKTSESKNMFKWIKENWKK